MHSSGSFLRTVVERVRAYLEEPDLDAKYTDDFLVRHMVSPAMVDVQTRLVQMSQVPVLNRVSIAVVTTTRVYQLPPCVGEVWRVAQYDEARNLLQDWTPRNFWAPTGPGWAIQGNQLVFTPSPSYVGTWDVEYTSNGDVLPHYAEAAVGGTLDAALTVMTLATAPTMGQVDKRPGSYAGQMLRTLPVGGIWEERVIDSHDVVAGTVTVRTPFTYATTGSGKAYEIAPAWSQALWEGTALAAAVKLAVIRRVPQDTLASLQMEYRQAMKTANDLVSNMQMRRARHWEKGTIDNPHLGAFG